MINVNNFGGSDTQKIQAAIDYAHENGGTVFIPNGYYVITKTLNVGLPEVSSYGFLVGRTDFIEDSDVSAVSISANRTVNLTKETPDIIFGTEAYLVADWIPENPEPVLAYHLSHNRDRKGGGKIVNPSIISAAVYVNGEHDYNNVSSAQENNLIGIWGNTGLKLIENAFVSGCEHGIAGVNNYWCSFRNIEIQWAGGDAFSLGQANAVEVSQIVIWNSNRGIVFDGDASAIKNIHCQTVAEDLVILSSDCCEFGPGYLEDNESSDDGTGLYSITLGATENTPAEVTHSLFIGLRVGAIRTNKSAIRIWGTAHGVFISCRVYGKTIDKDTYSYGEEIGCDFTLTNFTDV